VVRVHPAVPELTAFSAYYRETNVTEEIRNNKRTRSGPREQKPPPFVEFLNRYQPTLPEIICRANLVVLNGALQFLFAHLREARRLFDEEGDAGRLGAFTALGALVHFVLLFEKPNSETLHTPILRLQDALRSLDKNSVLPILAPTRRRGRGESSEAHLALKGHAAGTVRRLISLGVDRSDAHKKVAATLRGLGLRAERGPGDVTAGTIRNWCNEVSSDVRRNGTAAQVCDSMFNETEEHRFVSLSQTDARRFALESLSHWVQWLFPELRRAT
jgi:hypothetical protein